VKELSSLIEMIGQILVDMREFAAILLLLMVSFGLAMFLLHSNQAREVDGSFSTVRESIFTMVSTVCVMFAYC
jgi:hypothetical protein